MRKVIKNLGMVAPAALLWGCGGGGGSASSGGTGVSQLVGFYAGKGKATATTSPVTASLGIGSDGTLCGTLCQVRDKTKATVGGLVGDSGAITEGSIQCYKKDGSLGDLGTLTGQVTVSSPGANFTLTAVVKGKLVTFTFINLSATATPSARVKRKPRAEKHA